MAETIELNDHTDVVLGWVKKKLDLKNKSQAIEKLAEKYEQEFEPELRPEYVKKAKKIMKEKPVHIGDIGDFRRRYGPQ